MDINSSNEDHIPKYLNVNLKIIYCTKFDQKSKWNLKKNQIFKFKFDEMFKLRYNQN